MKKGIGLLSVLLAYQIHATPISNKEKAIAAFVAYQTNGTDAELNRQIADLNQDGFTSKGNTDAVALEGGCGIAGCTTSYLVTTSYQTVGANIFFKTTKAIVEASTFKEKGNVKKVFYK